MQELFRNVEKALAKVGLLPNANENTKYMFFNHHVDARNKTPDNTVIEPVENVSYLGSWISNTEHDLKVRQASAWIAYNKIRKVWTSKTPQRSDYLKQLWSLSYSMEVKSGP